jgi:hypothetical protein
MAHSLSFLADRGEKKEFLFRATLKTAMAGRTLFVRFASLCLLISTL